MRALLGAMSLFVFLVTVSCGGSDPTAAPTAMPSPAPTPTPTPTPTPGPRTQFGSGQWRVGTDIAAGRYYSAARSGCYWERQRGLSGATADIIANEFIGFNAQQWIVDILSTDLAFQTDADCGTWFSTQRTGPQTNIPPGIWLVGAQITAGTYRVDARSGCYWERLRNFQNTVAGIIDNEFVSSTGQQLVSISSSDVGFRTDDECGTWTRATALSPLAHSDDSSDIAADRQRARSRWQSQ